MVFECPTIKLEVKLENGLYVFEDQSSIGKTFIGSVISTLRAVGNQDAYYLTYASGNTEEDYIRLLQHNKDCLLYVVDRYDKYLSGSITDILRGVSSNAVVIVDSKVKLYMVSHKIASVERSNDLIRIY